MDKGRVLFLAALFLITSSFLSFAKAEPAEGIKIGYVDVAQAFDSYEKTKEQEKLLSAKGDEKKQQRDKMVDKIRNMKNELELLSDKQREAKQEQIDKEIIKLQDFDRETRSALRRERDEMVRDILREIDSVIKDYAQTKGYTIVLNSRLLVYAQEEYDITQEILKRLNSKYSKKN